MLAPPIVIIALVTAVLLMQPQPAQAPDQASVSPTLRRGQDLYIQRCSICHGLRAEGSRQGPTLWSVGDAAVDFMLSTGRMPTADPNQQPVRQRPAFSRDEMDAIIAYVTSLAPGGPSIPAIAPERGDVKDGRALYAANCLACHGAGAQGASVGGGATAPALYAATPTQIAEAVRIGPGVMPVFGPQVLDEQDLNSLIRYVEFLRGARDPGGLNLGYAGPVAEGFVAWLAGMGCLLLAAWLIERPT